MKYHLLTAAIAVLFSSSASADVSVESQDSNGDGKVTFQEFLDSHPKSIARNQSFVDRHQSVFTNADSNGDGVVDQSESQGGASGKTKESKHNKKQ